MKKLKDTCTIAYIAIMTAVIPWFIADAAVNCSDCGMKGESFTEVWALFSGMFAMVGFISLVLISELIEKIKKG